jgi:hypothetical protein
LLIVPLSRNVIFVTFLALSFVPARAGGVLVKVDENGRTLSLSAKDARLGDVLGELGKVFSFSIVGLKKARTGDRISGEFSGTLNVVLQRLLRNRNHMIVHAASNKGTINRVVLLSGSAGSLVKTLGGKQGRVAKYRPDREPDEDEPEE